MPEDRFNVEAIEKLIGHPIPPVVLEGLDPVDWVEEDGKRRRGRGKAKPKPASREKPATTEKPAARPRKAKADTPAPASGVRPPQSRPRAEPASQAPRRERSPRRDWARAEETGPSVLGFGEEVPAFMLLRRKSGRIRERTGDPAGHATGE